MIFLHLPKSLLGENYNIFVMIPVWCMILEIEVHNHLIRMSKLDQ